MSKDLLLSDEEWARLAAVTPEEKEKALKKLARWITEIGNFACTFFGKGKWTFFRKVKCTS